MQLSSILLIVISIYPFIICLGGGFERSHAEHKPSQSILLLSTPLSVFIFYISIQINVSSSSVFVSLAHIILWCYSPGSTIVGRSVNYNSEN